jgi:hypothetical protein
MNPEIKVKWLEALRNPTSRQAHETLEDDSGAYCCLGLLIMNDGVLTPKGKKPRSSFAQIADYIEENL